MNSEQVGIIASSLSVAKDITKAMVSIRDFNLVAEHKAAINQLLLDAQNALFANNAALAQLQDEHFKCTGELRELKEACRQRGRYPLVDVGNGQLAYWVDGTPQERGSSEPLPAQAPHYVCQQCLSRGIESIHQPRFERGINIGLHCGGCDTTLLNDAGIRYTSTAVAGPSGVMSYPKI